MDNQKECEELAALMVARDRVIWEALLNYSGSAHGEKGVEAAARVLRHCIDGDVAAARAEAGLTD